MQAMKKVFKFLGVVLIFIISASVLINLIDSEYADDVKTILNISLVSNPTDDQKCSQFLGLFVDQKLDAQKEGQILLDKIKSNVSNPKTIEEDVQVPGKLDEISPKEKCKSFCEFDKTERQSLKNKLKNQSVYLQRFRQLVDLGEIQCHDPHTTFKVPIMALFRITHHQFLDYNLLALEGDMQKAYEGLQKINRFYSNTLKTNKFNLVHSLIYLSLLKQSREMLVLLANKNPELAKKLHQSASQDFIGFTYEELVQRIQVGELQGGKALISHLDKGLSDFELFALFDNTDLESSIEKIQFNSFWAPILKATYSYFYLRNETQNDNLAVLRSSAWHPCVGQKDIPCEVKSPSPIKWIRNPIGKCITSVLTVGLADNFRKLRLKLESLPTKY